MQRQLRRAWVFAAILLAAGIAPRTKADEPPLRTGVEANFAPHAMPKLGGGAEGFNIDLAHEIGRRLHREVTIDLTSFSTLIPGLQAGRYDFLIAPVTVTKERAESLLFTEGYMYTGLQFAIRRGSPPLTSLDELHGKAISVNKGSIYDTWARNNVEKYGFTIDSYDTTPDAVQAVLSGHDYANLNGSSAVRYVAGKTPQYVPSLEIAETRAPFAIPLRRDEGALRDQIDNALKCMKRDGTLVKLSEKWFGVAPGPDALERVATPGYGVPGMPGYQPDAPAPNCG